jgi:hypothetical protein
VWWCAVCVVCVQLCGATLTHQGAREWAKCTLGPEWHASKIRAKTSGAGKREKEEGERRKERARAPYLLLHRLGILVQAEVRSQLVRHLLAPANRPTRARQQHATQQSVWPAVCHAQGAQGAQAAGGTCPNQAVLYVCGPRRLARSSAAICNPPTALHPARSRPPTHIHTHPPARPLARPRTPPLPSAHPPCSS